MIIDIVSLFMFLIGLDKIFISTSKILKGEFETDLNLLPFNLGRNFSFLPPVADYIISLILIVGAFALYMEWRWGLFLSLLALVLLVYSSLKNFSSSASEKGISGYGILNIIGFTGGAVSIIILILSY